MDFDRQSVDAIMRQVLQHDEDVSDVLITAGRPLQAEVNGALQSVPLNQDPGVFGPAETKAFAVALMGGNRRWHRQLMSSGACDFSYSVAGKARFRVNIFKQRGTLAVIMRKLPASVPTMESFGLPQVFADMATEQSGLVLVTGSTGTGKSNSLAALVDRINDTRAVHILTLEDPVEFAHRHKKATVNQRELGVDFDTFANGLRAAFRQSPKVILVGEIRDRETMDIVLQAAGTGHLVLSTLHTTDAGSTINRILGLFDSSEERIVRMKLAESLRCIVSQRLLPDVEHGRVAAFEILRSTMRIRELILNGESGEKTFYNVLAESGPHGMQTFDQHFFQLYKQGRITEETALLSASDRALLKRMIDELKSARGESVSDLVLEGLEESGNDDDLTGGLGR
ncbi:type IV pilus twitching motility protein PilT [Pseudodesulfovibrio senegalensis]|uniref:PilT/PilU family type 4a pilus ATPase n=1 Tax=Pseudodesulfovibrio senegalensis TaxID=1721087 RepID=A0A6N6N4R7_9BACT|nr:PilT/PilU family type 4a pilus ATPase [Pseudodesulfovibrio senegalensis]KAB1442218.1 PilT/PilU family type 4a pilus ATPase [Pseudodesulfovibrio senegalensis]